MKTQLLEDMGENASLAPAPAPAQLADNPKPAEELRMLAPAVEPEQPLVAAELDSVFEEIAALEAQLVSPVPPVLQHAADSTPAEAEAKAGAPPAASEAPLEPPRSLANGPASRLLQPAGRTVEPPAQLPPPPPLHTEPPPQPAYPPDDLAFIPDWIQRPAAQQDPLFDFTVPAQEATAAEPFTRPPTGLTPSGRRYLLWGGSVLSVALLAMGGRWFYQERNDAAALAFIANEAPQAEQRVKAAAQGPAAELHTATALPASRPAPALPPLVMLEPDPPGVATPGVATPNVATPGVATPAAATPEPPPPAPPAKDRVEPRTAPEPDTVALRKPGSPAPKQVTRKPRERTVVAATPVKERSKRESVRPPVRASALLAESPSQPDTSMSATLKACREHGYGATQCVKRGCSLTRYGFACRGR